MPKIVKPNNYRVCSICNIEKSFNNFGYLKNGWKNLNNERFKFHCRICENDSKAKLHTKKPYIRLFHNAKRRAKKKGLIFSITLEDVKKKFPKNNICPITKKSFKYGKENRHNNPTIDRIDNKKGYTFYNIVIVSFIANQVKGDLNDFSIFKQIADFYGDKKL